MKNIKQYEAHKNQRHIGKLFIRKPSTTYFRSNTLFKVFFIQDISGFGNYIDVFGKEIEFTNNEFFHYRDFEESFNDDDFNNTNFMTPTEFYNNYKESYIRIFQQLLDDSETNKLKPDDYRIKQMTIPEVEHISNARKYNL